MKRLLLAVALSVSLTALAATEFQTGLQALRSRDYVKALTAHLPPPPRPVTRGPRN